MLGSILFGWIAGIGAFLLAHGQLILGCAVGLCSLVASVYGIMVARANLVNARLTRRKLEVELGGSAESDRGRVLSFAAIAIAFLALPMVAWAQPLPELSPDNPLAPLMALLGGTWGLKVITWIGTFRIVGKPIAGKITELLESILAAVRASESKADDAIVDRVLRSAWYGVIAWLIDYVFSVKLPRELGARVDARNPASGVATAALLLAVLLPIAALSGCSTPERTAYRSLGTIAVTVDGAMNGWGEYVRAGRATGADQAKVRSAYERYQSAMRIAEQAQLAAAAAPDNQSSYVTAVSAVSAAADEIVALIHSFIPPPKPNDS